MLVITGYIKTKKVHLNYTEVKLLLHRFAFSEVKGQLYARIKNFLGRESIGLTF